MKFNTTYIATINLKNTIKEIAIIKQAILDLLANEYNLLDVDIPLFLNEDDEKIVDFKTISRSLTLDFAYESQIGRFLFSPTNYLRNLMNKLDIAFENGLIGEGKFVFRDLNQTPVVSVVKQEIVVQIKYENFDIAEVALKNILWKLHTKIYDLANDIYERYKVPNIVEKMPYFISAQDLEIEYPNQTYKEREIAFSQEKNAFWLVAPGKVLYSGHIHTALPMPLYDVRHFYQLVLRDRVNSNVIKPVQISILANGIQLSDQLDLYDQEKFKARNFYKKLMQEKFKVMEIRINIPRIAMAILGKGHICEVQPGIISDETEIISQKFNVENY